MKLSQVRHEIRMFVIVWVVVFDEWSDGVPNGCYYVPFYWEDEKWGELRFTKSDGKVNRNKINFSGVSLIYEILFSW